MEASVTAGQASIYGRTSIKGTPPLNVKPFFGFFYKPITRLSRMHSCHINRPANRVSNEIFAAADFSRRKPRKVSSSQSRGPGKGFVPKTQAETGTLKKGRPSKEKSRSVSSPRQMNRRVPEVRVDIDDNLASGTSQGMNVEEELNDGIKGKVLPESEPVAIVSNNELKENVSISAISDSPSATILVEEQVKNEANTAVETGLDGFSGSEEYVVLGSGINKVAEENVSAYKLMKSGNEVRSAVVWTRPDALDGSEDAAFVESYEGREAKEKVSEWKSISEIEAPVMIRQESVDNVCEKATQESDKTREAGENAGKIKVLSENKAQVASVATLPDIIEGSGDDLIFDIHDNRETEEIVSETKIIKSEVCSSDIVAYNVEEMGSSSQVIHAGMDAFVHEDCPSVLVEDASDVFTGEGSRETNESISLTEVEKSETLEGTGPIANKAGEEKFSKSLKSEMEALVHKEVIDELAEDNFSRGNNLFTYPQAVKPDQEIEIFFNRSLSTLKHEPDVMIMGAYNDWCWKSFTVKLDKSHFSGDWWSCHIHVPKEAYGIDFVFFNGKDVYDNNNRKDFHIYVEGGMDADSFEDFLLEEKLRELEKLAKEQAEREKIEEENRRFAEENAAKEADRSQAKLEVQRRREKLIELINKAKKSADNIWYLEPSNFKDKDMVRLYYNRSSGPLAEANDIWIHGGHNGWADGLSIVAKLVKSERMDADWWYTEVTVPEGAIILDWVFADGPPKLAHCYDNNHHQDFHGVFPNSLPGEAYWIEEEEQIYQKLQDERRQRELVIRAKAEKTARLKAERRKQTVKRFLLSQKHIVYTDPLDVRAGSLVTIYYNPANTVLSGKTEIWFRCSFNRWTHRNGLLPPQKMVLAENASHFKTTVKVPLDSYVMDFVFSEREGGGVFDNKDGMDYHVPVYGGVTKEPPMHIVHIAVEMAPIAKVGGLGDVVTSLSRAVKDLKHHVDIILPKYDCLNLSVVKDLQYNRSFSWGGTEIKVWCGKVEGLFVYFLEPQNGFFWKGCVYGCGNDAERFGFFCHAALEFLLQTGLHPDIIHCHDWSSAPVAWLYKDHYRHYGLSKARVVFTIHNLEFGAQLIGKAMQYSDKATTVSHTYSKEIAGHPAIAPYLYKFHGILNGIDPDIWDPFNDKFIPVHYTSENVIEGKKAAKEALQRRLGLKVADIPLVGIISRLTHQKGIHLIKHAIWRTLERNGQAVLLGSAPDPRIQNDFVNLANQLHSSHNDRARFCLTYDEPLSHLIYAGADFIVVPSMFEPCGLTQLVAMRYGAIPVVRKTGGLYDTVYDVDHDKERAEAQGLEPNGFSFEGADASGIDYALNRAISAWYDGPDWFYSLCKRVMDQDWSWNRPALDYLELYHAARKY